MPDIVVVPPPFLVPEIISVAEYEVVDTRHFYYVLSKLLLLVKVYGSRARVASRALHQNSPSNQTAFTE